MMGARKCKMHKHNQYFKKSEDLLWASWQDVNLALCFLEVNKCLFFLFF